MAHRLDILEEIKLYLSDGEILERIIKSLSNADALEILEPILADVKVDDIDDESYNEDYYDDYDYSN